MATAFFAVAVLFASGCVCTRPDCRFGIASPSEGQTLPPGDVDVVLTPQRGGMCAYPAHDYDVRLDDGTAVRIPGSDAALRAHFTGVASGEHVARAVALDSLGRPIGDASVHFFVEAPPPTPVVAPPPPAAVPTAETPAEVPLDIQELNRRGYLKDIFYDFDKDEIRRDQRDTLAGNAEWLKKNPTVKITIEGHCDERGTRQYNLALGERRASSAREYLGSLGVDASRVTTVSYGKDRPFDLGHDEKAWAKNRRAHFVITAK
jgi:peptidoglycan-associated lipoprotein